MIFTQTPIDGAVLVELELNCDERGTFARSFSADEFSAHGLFSHPVEANISHNLRAGTLRGMHYQRPPFPDPKLVRCTEGSMFDVVVDLRAGSPTLLEWVGVELSARNGMAIHVPPGCAHGFLTLEPHTVVAYLMGERYRPELAGGVRWNDPAFDIAWPHHPDVISERDANYPDFDADTTPMAAGS